MVLYYFRLLEEFERLIIRFVMFVRKIIKIKILIPFAQKKKMASIAPSYRDFLRENWYSRILDG